MMAPAIHLRMTSCPRRHLQIDHAREPVLLLLFQHLLRIASFYPISSDKSARALVCRTAPRDYSPALTVTGRRTLGFCSDGLLVL